MNADYSKLALDSIKKTAIRTWNRIKSIYYFAHLLSADNDRVKLIKYKYLSLKWFGVFKR